MPKPAVLHRVDVVLMPFPFADLTGAKLRPAVIISADPQTSEVIVAFITSVLTNRSPRGADVEVSRGDPGFRATGLKTESLIRADKLVTLSRAMVSRRLGVIGLATWAKLAAKLAVAFGL